ncbi:tubulin beta chain [Apiospora sp. TS-2023a]
MILNVLLLVRSLFPRLHFLVAGSRPLLNRDGHPTTTNPIFGPENIRELLNPANLAIASGLPNGGRYLACSAIFRGEAVRMQEVQDQLELNTIISSSSRSTLNNWILPRCNVQATWASSSATLVGNSTVVRGVFGRSEEQFASMFRRKAYIWGYTSSHLMDEMEFVEAQSNVLDLMEEYRLCEEDGTPPVNCRGDGDDGERTAAAEPVRGVVP